MVKLEPEEEEEDEDDVSPANSLEYSSRVGEVSK
jgi:hypothetical protein